MPRATSIGVNDEEDIITNLADRLHPDLSVVATGVPLLQCRSKKEARRVIETETSFTQIAPALSLISLKEHDRIYTL